MFSFLVFLNLVLAAGLFYVIFKDLQLIKSIDTISKASTTVTDDLIKNIDTVEKKVILLNNEITGIKESLLRESRASTQTKLDLLALTDRFETTKPLFEALDKIKDDVEILKNK